MRVPDRANAWEDSIHARIQVLPDSWIPRGSIVHSHHSQGNTVKQSQVSPSLYSRGRPGPPSFLYKSRIPYEQGLCEPPLPPFSHVFSRNLSLIYSVPFNSKQGKYLLHGLTPHPSKYHSLCSKYPVPTLPLSKPHSHFLNLKVQMHKNPTSKALLELSVSTSSLLGFTYPHPHPHGSYIKMNVWVGERTDG